MFQVQKPIWKPHIKYQEYWQLVNSNPGGPIETYPWSYLVDWSNQIARDFLGHIAQPTQVFRDSNLLWQNSTTCKQLAGLVSSLLGATTVKKVLCFGLGDFCRTAPEWLKRQHDSWDETSDVTHDPDYTALAEDILTKKEFKIVGHHGAGGFAEIDDESIVISAFTAAPVKQIIADIARPALIISTGFGVFNDDE
ncbi:hypothetical protein N7456_002629 [Penicillium angulare]|uniref:SRR1-like domain-containing protein n=1 Tax=Penicillium angulare TaxID=116970 RepID=A0A9W9G9K7_9EURO|nr:hypothetical protein N7456_002629 [Penicillium angulare]